jgi:hypothetical protein
MLRDKSFTAYKGKVFELCRKLAAAANVSRDYIERLQRAPVEAEILGNRVVVPAGRSYLHQQCLTIEDNCAVVALCECTYGVLSLSHQPVSYSARPDRCKACSVLRNEEFSQSVGHDQGYAVVADDAGDHRRQNENSPRPGALQALTCHPPFDQAL